MNYAQIKPLDIANGEGIRVSLFVSGCTHHCKGCFNAIAWDFNYGRAYTKQIEDEIISMLLPEHISGLSLLGGEPFEIENQRALLPLIRRVNAMENKSIWAYTGYTLERDLFAANGKAHCEVTSEILNSIDVLVDGEFVEDLKDISLLFRGSSNQRIINMQNFLKANRAKAHPQAHEHLTFLH